MSILERQPLIVHAMPLIAESLTAIACALRLTVGMRVATFNEAFAAIGAQRFGLVVFGGALEAINEADLRGACQADAIKTAFICSASDHRSMLVAVERNADGLLPDNASIAAVQSGIAAAVAGRRWIDPSKSPIINQREPLGSAGRVSALTRRESQIARLVAAGHRNRIIGETLGITEGTVKKHLHHIYTKLGLQTRTRVVMDKRAGSTDRVVPSH